MLKRIGHFLGISVNEDEELVCEFKPFNYLLIVMFLIVVFSSPYMVDKKENATVCILGEYAYTAEPGLNFKAPWPIAVEEKTEVTKVKRIELGFETIKIGPPAQYRDIPEESLMLTGDDNIVSLDFIIQYRSYDARKWQFTVDNPEKLMRYLGEASMRLIVGKTDFDALATYGKQEVQQQVFALLQELCDTIDFGAKVVAIQLQDVNPPEPVQHDYKDVLNAKEEKQDTINKAERERNRIIPLAKGKAEQFVNEAKGYAARTVDNAEGKAKRWEQVRKEYAKAKAITRDRLVFETLQKFLEDADITIDKSKAGTLKHYDITGKEIPVVTEQKKGARK